MKKNTINLCSKKVSTKITFLLTTLFFLFFCNQSNAQTVLINPAGNGGFETGTTFALNGWTENNPATGNRWTCNTNVSGLTGVRCAYISRNLANHQYTFTNTSIVHLSRTVTVPAGETSILLNFDWQGRGESFFDYLTVWAVNTAYVPTSGTAITANANRVNLSGDLDSQASWTNLSLTLPTTYAGTSFKLVFEWRNDNSFGTNPPAAIDNISLTSEVAYNPCTTTPVIAACGTNITRVVAAGNGAISPSPCGWTSPGKEYIYRFTPATSGNYAIQQVSSTYTWVDYSYKTVSSGCGTTGWTCIQDLTGAATSGTIALTAGVQYYIMLDPEAVTTGGTVVFNIVCPAYCTPSTTSSVFYISGITTVGTLADASNAPTGYSTGGYTNYTGITIASQAPLGPVNIEINLIGGHFIKTYVDWNNDLDFDDANELVYDTGLTATGDTTYGFIVPSGVVAGNYRMRVKTRGYINAVSDNTITPCNTYTYGETEDYTLNIVNDCPAKITSVTNGSNCGTGTVVLGAVGSSGTTGFKWYANINDVVPLATTGTGSWTTPSISSTTTYYVTAINATPCESLIKTSVKATIKPTTNITFTPAAPIVCGDNNIITISATGDIEEVDLINENFEGGLGVFTSTTPTNIGGGVDTPWSVKTSTYQPTTTTVFRPALSSGNIGNKFAFTTSDYTNSNIITDLTTTASIDASTYSTLTLTFRHYYSYFGGDSGKVEVSTNGGTTWLPANVIATYNSDIGSPSKFQNVTLNMNAYAGAGFNNLKIRFRYEATWDDGWAIDDVRLFGTRPLTAAFTWSGATVDAYTDFACTIPYVSQLVSTLYIKPTAAQLLLASWTFTGTVTLSNGCSVSSPLTVTNNTKIWQGGTTNWATASNWLPNGVPTINNCVVIPNNTVISGTNYNAYGKNLLVKNGGNLNIQPSNNLTIADDIIVESTGTFQIENNSNLVQINNTINTGNIIYKRTASGIRGSDYVYWSSPVANQALGTIYSSPTPGNRYEWNTLIVNSNGASGNTSQGNWVNAPAIMSKGKGYIMRGSSNFAMTATNINSTFTGVPNNGTIPVLIYRGVYTGPPYAGANGVQINNLDDNYNLLGNPYPSAINAYRFIYDNRTLIEGNVKLWTHGTSPGLNNGGTITNPFYGTFSYNYAANDYVTLNYVGATIPTFSSSIRAGQGFFVEMKDGATGSGTVNFTNIQRRDASGNPYSNSGFFKNSDEPNDDIDNLERHRIWLDILNANNVAERTLVGYVEGATMGKDSPYDAIASALTMGIYSVLNNESLVIQGRSLPFDDNDEVAIGFNVPSAGTYRIAINTVDGLFLGTQDIYLKDELLNTYHNLKSAPYSFTTTAGIHDDRFKLVYKNTVLSNVTFNENEIQIAKNKNTIEIVSGNEIMENVKVFDIRGRLIVEKTKINNNTISIDVNGIQDQVLIVNITTSEGIKVTKKIL